MTDEPHGVDLSLVGEDELIAEMKRRNEALLVVRCKPHTNDETRMFVDWSGTMSHSLGLAHWAAQRFEAHIREMTVLNE